ncbi:MAG: hypothetical protein ABSA05_02395 [Opitutaceae bacterium]
MIRAFLILSLAAFAGCSRGGSGVSANAPAPPDEPPHGGTPVALGKGIYHVELVRDANAGKIDAYVLDGEMEDFVRTAVSSFDIVATVNGEQKTLVFKAMPNSATGETVGDTSCFEARADWITTTPAFDAVLTRIEVRGTSFENVAFNFPRGNDTD